MSVDLSRLLRTTKPAAEYVIFADESDKVGPFFSNFYGAALVRSTHINEVEQSLRDKKASLNLNSEIKWSKTPAHDVYFERYKEVMDLFFDYIKRDIVKIRIMFTQNINVPVQLSKEQRDNQFFLLYYQFIKHCFGLQYCDEFTDDLIRVKFYFDDLSSPEISTNRFKDFIYMLDTTQLWGSRFVIRREDVAEVRSHDHCILQCMDIILGAMCFRLNDKHREIPEGKKRRAKKTVYKEKLYRHIYGHINEIHLKFNPGTSTGSRGGIENRWKHAYRHWLFVPKEYEVDLNPALRKKQREAPSSLG